MQQQTFSRSSFAGGADTANSRGDDSGNSHRSESTERHFEIATGHNRSVEKVVKPISYGITWECFAFSKLGRFICSQEGADGTASDAKRLCRLILESLRPTTKCNTKRSNYVQHCFQLCGRQMQLY